MADNRLSEALGRKYQRLIDLMAAPGVVQVIHATEMEDLRRDILASGQTEADLEAHTSPNRFDA